MKKILLGCAVAAAVSLSFNVSAHDTSGHTATNSGSVKHSSETSTSSVSNTVKTDAKKVYAGAKEYGHKAYDATKKTAKSAYDSSKHMLSSGHHKASTGVKKDKAKAATAPVKAAPVKAAPVKSAPAKTDSPTKPSVWEKFKGGVSKAYHGTKNTVSGWFSKDKKKEDAKADAKKS